MHVLKRYATTMHGTFKTFTDSAKSHLTEVVVIDK